MKFLCSLLLSFSLLSTSAFASAPGLKEAIEEFTYALEVEWDQKDVPFYQKELARFQQKMEKLHLQTTSKKELLLEGLSYLPNSRFQQDVSDRVMQMTEASLTLPMVLQILEEASNNGNRGANWNGRDNGASLAVAGVILIIMVAIIVHGNHDRRVHHRDHHDNEEPDIRTPPWIMEPVPEDETQPTYGCDYYPGCEKN